MVWQLAEGLRKTHGCEVAVACDDGSELGRLEAIGIRHARVEFSREVGSFWGARRSLRSFYREFRPDLVHSHSRWPSMVSVAAGRRPDVSTLHAQQMTSSGSALDRGRLRRLLSQWGRSVTVLDEAAKCRLVVEAGLVASRIVVVPNGADASRFRPPAPSERHAARAQFGIGVDERVLLFAGAMTAVKRATICVESLAAALGRRRDVWLLLLGDGPARAETEALAERLGVRDRCVFAGWRDDPREAYWAADLLGLPSAEEGFALVCVEAMLCGVPCVRTRTGGWSQQIREGTTGWTVEVDDVQGFVRRAADVLCDEERCRAVGAAASTHARLELTGTKFIERMWDVYQRVLQERGTA